MRSKGQVSAQLRDSISFPVELMEGMKAQEKQKLICICIRSAGMFLVSAGNEGARGEPSPQSSPV